MLPPRILTAHRHAEAPTRLGGTRVQHHDPWREATRDVDFTLEPEGVAGDIEEVAGTSGAERKADNVAGIDTDGAMARQCSGYKQLLAVSSSEGACHERSETDRISSDAVRPGGSNASHAEFGQERSPGVIQFSVSVRAALSFGKKGPNFSTRYNRIEPDSNTRIGVGQL